MVSMLEEKNNIPRRHNNDLIKGISLTDTSECPAELIFHKTRMYGYIYIYKKEKQQQGKTRSHKHGPKVLNSFFNVIDAWRQ